MFQAPLKSFYFFREWNGALAYFNTVILALTVYLEERSSKQDGTDAKRFWG